MLIIFQSILLDKCHVIYYEQNLDCLVFRWPVPYSFDVTMNARYYTIRHQVISNVFEASTTNS